MATKDRAAGVLTHQAIIRLCGLEFNELAESNGTKGPVRPCLRANVRSASYDLRLGEEYFLRNSSGRHWRWGQKVKTRKLDESCSRKLTIDPNRVVIVTAAERVHLSDDIVGHLSLKQDILLQGLIMASQSQIDAGYRGQIFALFYNLSDSPVTLEFGDSILRLEFVRLAEATTKPYHGDFQGIELAKALKKPLGSSLEDLRDQVDRTKLRLRQIPVVAIATIVVAIALASLTGFVGWAADLNERIVRVEEKVGPADGGESSAADREDIANLRCEVHRLSIPPENRGSIRC